MKRRHFLKSLGLLSSCAVFPKFTFARTESDFSGKFLVTIEAPGGWDVSAFCDPKMNVPGEPIINHWAESAETQTIGNLNYAPFADNAAFFNKYYQDMLVINGIDSQTNSHTTGVINVWSGRLSSGYPTVTSLYAANQNLDIPIPYISNAGYRETAGVIRSTLLDNPYSMLRITDPNQAWIEDPNSRLLHFSDSELISEFQLKRLQRLLGKEGATQQQLSSRRNVFQSISSSDKVKQFTDLIQAAPELEQPNGVSNLGQQAQLAMMAFASGVAISADLSIGGDFDSHALNDSRQEPGLRALSQGLDTLYKYAEQYGIDDRVVVVIGSEFSRTPYYNDEDGKDHWPTGSMLIIERGAAWGNRVVGHTDEQQFASKINPTTLAIDENGSYIYPRHVMLALRNYLGFADDENAIKYGFPNTELFDLFNASLMTEQGGDPRNLIR